MFTIVHKRYGTHAIYPTEEVFKAVQLQYIATTDETGESAGLHLLCGPDEAGRDPSVKVGTLRDGIAYVMNDMGATVATYYLDAPKSPPPKVRNEPKAA